MTPARTAGGAAPVRVLLVLSTLLGSACLARAAPPGDPTPPVARAPAAPREGSDEPAPIAIPPPAPSDYVPWRGEPPVPGGPLTAGSTSASPPAGEDPVPVPIPEPRVEIEAPYPLYERPRPAGAVAAATHDERIARFNVGGSSDPNYPSNLAGFHPGTRVIVHASVPGGDIPERAPVDRRTGRPTRTLSRSAIVAQARRDGYWPFRLCMEDGLRRSADLAGKTVVDLSLSSSGRVSAARLVRADLDDDGVQRCLVAAARRLAFTPPPPRPLRVRLEVALSAGDAPVLRTGPPEGTEPPNAGRVDLAATRQALTTALPSLLECHADGLARDFGLWGRLQVLIELDERGVVVAVGEDESRFPDRVTSACACEALRRVSFPSPEGGAARLVVGIRFGAFSDHAVTE